jgi:putative ABC transport system permease protein
VIVIILAVAANTMAMSVRERTGEYAVFKTLGFGGFYLAVMILGESMTITAIGGIIGMLLTYPAADAFGEAVGDFIPVFIVSGDTLLLEAAAIIVVGVAAAIIPIWRTVKVPIAAGLGRVG